MWILLATLLFIGTFAGRATAVEGGLPPFVLASLTELRAQVPPSQSPIAREVHAFASPVFQTLSAASARRLERNGQGYRVTRELRPPAPVSAARALPMVLLIELPSWAMGGQEEAYAGLVMNYMKRELEFFNEFYAGCEIGAHVQSILLLESVGQASKTMPLECLWDNQKCTQASLPLMQDLRTLAREARPFGVPVFVLETVEANGQGPFGLGGFALSEPDRRWIRQERGWDLPAMVLLNLQSLAWYADRDRAVNLAHEFGHLFFGDHSKDPRHLMFPSSNNHPLPLTRQECRHALSRLGAL